MVFCVSKIGFYAGTDLNEDLRQLTILCKKLKKRFNICVMIDRKASQIRPTILLSCIHESDNELSKLLDQVTDFCEESGYGRVEEESSFFESFDNLHDM